jgi:hypothetical protein
MKALKINTTVNLTNGLTIPSGAIVVIGEGTAVPNPRKLVTVEGVKKIPCSVITNVYKSLAAFTAGDTAITGIKDFNPAFYGLTLSVEGYATLPTETLQIEVVKQSLEAVYPGQIEEITIPN